MVTGAPPWQHDTLLQICTAVGVSKQSPPLPEGLPPQVEALMRSCFEADPARRPTAAHLLKVGRIVPCCETCELMPDTVFECQCLLTAVATTEDLRSALQALQAMGSALERPQLMRAANNLQRNSQLLAAARGVLSGLQQDCCQLVQQLNEREQAAAPAGRPGGLGIVEEEQDGQQHQQQRECLRDSKEKQSESSSEDTDKQVCWHDNQLKQ